MPFKTSDHVWVESCDRPPSNTRSSVHFHVPKTGRHLAWLSGGTDCYSPGMLPIPPPVPKNFPLDVSSARVVRRRSSNLLRGQNDVPEAGKTVLERWVSAACRRSCVLIWLIFVFFFFVFLTFTFIYLRPRHDYPNTITLEAKCLLALIITQTEQWIWFHYEENSKEILDH